MNIQSGRSATSLTKSSHSHLKQKLNSMIHKNTILLFAHLVAYVREVRGEKIQTNTSTETPLNLTCSVTL